MIYVKRKHQSNFSQLFYVNAFFSIWWHHLFPGSGSIINRDGKKEKIGIDVSYYAAKKKLVGSTELGDKIFHYIVDNQMDFLESRIGEDKLDEIQDLIDEFIELRELSLTYSRTIGEASRNQIFQLNAVN